MRSLKLLSHFAWQFHKMRISTTKSTKFLNIKSRKFGKCVFVTDFWTVKFAEDYWFVDNRKCTSTQKKKEHFAFIRSMKFIFSVWGIWSDFIGKPKTKRIDWTQFLKRWAFCTILNVNVISAIFGIFRDCTKRSLKQTNGKALRETVSEWFHMSVSIDILPFRAFQEQWQCEACDWKYAGNTLRVKTNKSLIMSNEHKWTNFVFALAEDEQRQN